MPKPWRQLVVLEESGNFAKNHPIEILKFIQENDANFINKNMPRKKEAIKLLNKNE